QPAAQALTSSFPSSAWERKGAKLCFAAVTCAGCEAELRDVRSQAELGNEKPQWRGPPMTLYPQLVRNVFQPLSLWRAGELAQLRYLREFERTQFLTADEVRQLQWERLRTLLQHAYDQCSFYRRRFDRAGLTPGDLHSLEDLRALPVLEKRD